MSNNKSHPPSKPSPQSGISSNSSKDLSTRVADLEKFIKDNLNENNQWNDQVRKWVGKKVFVRVMHDVGAITGTLKWVDRYTLCLEDDLNAIIVVHKGAIATISLD